MWKDFKSGFDRFVEASRVRKVIYLLDQLWVRITVIGALSLVSILLARVLEPLIPDGVGDLLGAGSVEVNFVPVPGHWGTLPLSVKGAPNGTTATEVHRRL